MSALRDSGHAQQGTGQGGVAEDQRRNMKNDSDSEAEVRKSSYKVSPISRWDLATNVEWGRWLWRGLIP